MNSKQTYNYTNLYIYFKFIDEYAFILNQMNWKLICPFSISAELIRYTNLNIYFNFIDEYALILNHN